MIAVGASISDTVESAQLKYYNLPLLAEGVTIRLSVSEGSVVCYASDRTESPNEQRGYDWMIETTWYSDDFIDPTSLGRSAGSTVFISCEGVQDTNTFKIDTSEGDRATESKPFVLYLLML